MTQDNAQNEMLEFETPPKLSSGLNVLTILTFVGCALQLIFAVFGYFNAQSSYAQKDKIMEQMNSGNLPSWAKSMMGDTSHMEEMLTKSYENRIPILLLTLVAAALCIFGAIQMRKLKKQGYLLYLVGEILPFAILAIFIGTFSLAGIGFYVSACIALLFILMYTLQRKNLVH